MLHRYIFGVNAAIRFDLLSVDRLDRERNEVLLLLTVRMPHRCIPCAWTTGVYCNCKCFTPFRLAPGGPAWATHEYSSDINIQQISWRVIRNASHSLIPCRYPTGHLLHSRWEATLPNNLEISKIAPVERKVSKFRVHLAGSR